MIELNLQQKLGQGTFGTVYKAIYQGQLRAVKKISLRKVHQFNLTNHLQRQITLMKRLDHVNIVRCFDAPIDDDKNYQYIVMELCDCNLREYILANRQVFKTDKCMCTKITLQILNALAYLKRNRIANRDIKMDNIVVKKVGDRVSDIEIKLTDFGQARQFINASVTSYEIGTIGYMSPEIKNKQIFNYNESCDFWSAGIVLYQLFQGLDQNVKLQNDCELSWPFKANLDLKKISEINMFYSSYIINNPLTLSKLIPTPIRNIIRGLLKVQVDKRITIEQITKLCIVNQEQIFKGFTTQQKQFYSNQFIVWQIQQRQLQQQKQGQKIIKEEIKCIYYELLKRIEKALSSLCIKYKIYNSQILKINTVLQAAVFLCQVYVKVMKRFEQLQTIYHWKEQDFRDLIQEEQLDQSKQTYKKYLCLLAQFKYYPEEMPVNPERVKAFITSYCRLYVNSMLKVAAQHFQQIRNTLAN